MECMTEYPGPHGGRESIFLGRGCPGHGYYYEPSMTSRVTS